jgi:DNA-binding winged helix-turn-helix (wHTH) protein
MDETVRRVLRFNEFTLDLTRGCLRSGDRSIELRPKAFAVLHHLAQNGGRLVPKQELYQAVWPDVVVSDDSLVQCIRELRDKLGDEEHRLIKTVHRRGYLLDAAIADDDAGSRAPIQATNLSSSGPGAPSRPRALPLAADNEATEATAAPTRSNISANLLKVRALPARQWATASAILVAIGLACLGLWQWLRPLSGPPTGTALRAPNIATAGTTIPLTVRQFSTDMGSDLPGLAAGRERVAGDRNQCGRRRRQAGRSLHRSRRSADAR